MSTRGVGLLRIAGGGRTALRRLGFALSAAILILSAVAIPVEGARSTRWVDNDRGADGGPAACRTAPYTTIQAAINASRSGDRVMVCPGRYREQVTVDRQVALRAKPANKATIVAPGSMSLVESLAAIVRITGNRASLRGFGIEAATNGGAGILACRVVDAAIVVASTKVTVRDNRISATNGRTLTGGCGYRYGVVVGSDAALQDASTPIAVRARSVDARVRSNTIVDFRTGGILVSGPKSNAVVRQNTVSFLHLTEPASAAAAADAFGIAIHAGAQAQIKKNSVASGPAACVALTSCVSGTPALAAGISLDGLDAADRTTVRNNTVSLTHEAIATNATVGGRVLKNTLSKNVIGLHLGGASATVSDNVATLNAYGAVVSGRNNNLQHNDLRGNQTLDCSDTSASAGTPGTGTLGTWNTWAANEGATDSPVGICADTGPPPSASTLPSTAPSTGPSTAPSTAPSSAPSTAPSTAPSAAPPTAGVALLVGNPQALTTREQQWLTAMRADLGAVDVISYSAATADKLVGYFTIFVIDTSAQLDVNALKFAFQSGLTLNLVGPAAAYQAQATAP